MIPTLPVFDSGPGLLADTYRYLGRASAKAGADVFRTRIAGRPALCLHGAEAARFFYEGGRFDRSLSIPPTVLHLLQDTKSVQTLEGSAHAQRKKGFLTLLQGGEGRLQGIAWERFGLAVRSWSGGTRVQLDDALPVIFAEIAMRWAGIPEDRAEIDVRAPELWAMVTEAGAFGPSNWIAQLRRQSTEAWARLLIEDVRAGSAAVVTGTPLAAVAAWTDEDGRPLPAKVAATELLNLLRPIVAVALFAEFAVLALLARPSLRPRLAERDPELVAGFVHEVRRRTPFFPLIAGRATRDVDWHGEPVPAGTWTILDLYGTNHDPRLWPRPNAFDPDRYARGAGDARYIVAQGTGDDVSSHHCPGESTTEVLLTELTRAIAAVPIHAAPGQSFEVTWSRRPARVVGGLAVTVA